MDTIDSLRIRIGELELALEEAEERNVSRELEQTTKALAKMNGYAAHCERRIESITKTATSLASESAVVLSKLRPHMMLQTNAEWDALEDLHNRLARFQLPDATPVIADLVEAQHDGTVDEWRAQEDAKRAARASSPIESSTFTDADFQMLEEMTAGSGAKFSVLQTHTQPTPDEPEDFGHEDCTVCDAARAAKEGGK